MNKTKTTIISVISINTPIFIGVVLGKIKIQPKIRPRIAPIQKK